MAIAVAFFCGSTVCPAGCVPERATSVNETPVDKQDRRWTISVGGTVRYTLAWDWETAQQEGDGWHFETDLGYLIHLTEAYVNSNSVELRPCEDQTAATTSRWIASAYADHSYEGDSSKVEGPYLESFGDPARPIGFGAASGWTYCEAVYIIAPTDADGDATEETEAIRLSGSYTAPNGEPVPFEASVALTGGASVGLPPAPSETPLGVVFTVTRFPARAFDGIRFEDLVGTEIAWEVLANLSASAMVTAEVIAP